MCVTYLFVQLRKEDLLSSATVAVAVRTMCSKNTSYSKPFPSNAQFSTGGIFYQLIMNTIEWSTGDTWVNSEQLSHSFYSRGTLKISIVMIVDLEICISRVWTNPTLRHRNGKILSLFKKSKETSSVLVTWVWCLAITTTGLKHNNSLTDLIFFTSYVWKYKKYYKESQMLSQVSLRTCVFSTASNCYLLTFI